MPSNDLQEVLQLLLPLLNEAVVQVANKLLVGQRRYGQTLVCLVVHQLLMQPLEV